MKSFLKNQPAPIITWLKVLTAEDVAFKKRLVKRGILSYKNNSKKIYIKIVS